MAQFANSVASKNVINKIFLAFIFYVVASASFSGFYLSYAFMDRLDKRRNFEAMYYENADRPFVYRQLMLQVAKKISDFIPKDVTNPTIKRMIRGDYDHNYTNIELHYGLSVIRDEFYVEYHLLYFMCFGCIFFSMFLWREIGIELTGNELVGTLTACCFALIFPILEVRGVFYDCAEVFFCSLMALCACKGNWLGILILSPIAEYNKESTLFFVLSLYPLLASKLSYKKASLLTIFSAFLCGLVYLYVSATYAGNGGGAVEFHFWDHVGHSLHLDCWFNFRFVYGEYFFNGFSVFNIFLIALIFYTAFKELPSFWQTHIKFLMMVNIPLYIFLCAPDELRNFSLMYVGFIAMLSIFINKAIYSEQKIYWFQKK